MASPLGAAPVVPGLTQTNGISPDAMDPLQMIALLMGLRPEPETSAADKIEQVIRLLREVAREDPRIGFLANDALRLLVEGPALMRGSPGWTPPTPVGGAIPSGPI